MLSEDVKIKFLGFEPSHDMRSSFYFFLNRLHLKSPHQSLMDATFTLTNGIIEGAIKITNGAEHFAAKASDVQVTRLGEKLVDKIGSQLDKWKSLRCL